jgi:hypothetical protein
VNFDFFFQTRVRYERCVILRSSSCKLRLRSDFTIFHFMRSTTIHLSTNENLWLMASVPCWAHKILLHKEDQFFKYMETRWRSYTENLYYEGTLVAIKRSATLGLMWLRPLPAENSCGWVNDMPHYLNAENCTGQVNFTSFWKKEIIPFRL